MTEFAHRLSGTVVLALAAILLSVAEASDRIVTFEGCADARGKAVESRPDERLTTVASATVESYEPVVRYNPVLLPRLSERARLFFYAHECARHALAQPLDVPRTLERARKADCLALATLRQAGALGGERAVAELQSELKFSETEWRMLPGPQRAIGLDTCKASGVLRLPDRAPPSEAQDRINRCVHACGDRLWQCQNRCRDSACRGNCEAVYGQCEAGCGGR